jgi:hypothetical protein
VRLSAKNTGEGEKKEVKETIVKEAFETSLFDYSEINKESEGEKGGVFQKSRMRKGKSGRAS